MEPTPHPVIAEARLGSFEIVRKLARGGMAEIFLARTLAPSGSEQLVVVKKIRPSYAGKARYVQLFLEEAQLAASLVHPHIARVYDVGVKDGSYFFAMEYLHGQDVRSVLHRTWRIREQFPVALAVQIARHVAAALHFAHDQRREDGGLRGIVHRDVSPSNVIVTYAGATKLLDFGVAKTAASTVKTRTGSLKGKVAYMSPEQARGAPIDRRSDIFSLGIVLWEMLTTQRLYRADNDLATLQLIIHQPPPPPSGLNSLCPPELDRIALRALAKDPDARYATADELRRDLEVLAAARGFDQSPESLAAKLSVLFAPELGAWQEARASGTLLIDHLADAGEITTIGEVEILDPSDISAVLEEDDDELTEHAAPPIDALAPIATDRMIPAVVGPRAMPRGTGQTPSLPVLADPDLASSADREATIVSLPELTEPSGQRAQSEVTTEATIEATVELTSPQFTELGVAAPPPPPPTTKRPTTPPGGLGLVPRSPFAAPPWQSGQPSPVRLDSTARSWAVIDLPAYDPAAFARHRQVAVRVAAAVLTLIIVLALALGRC